MFHLLRWLALVLTLSITVPLSTRSQNHSQELYLPLVTRPMPTPDSVLDYAAPPVPGVFDVANFRIWIPGNVPIIRGVVVYTPGINSDGRDFVTDPAWQAIARQWQFALVGDQFVGSDWSYFTSAATGSGQALLDALSNFATTSSKPEIANIPMALFGFSAGGYYSASFTAWLPERVIAFASDRGATGTFDNAALQVPGIIIVGDTTDDQTDKMNATQFFQQQRAKGALIAFATEWGTGHCVCQSPDFSMPLFDQAIRDRLPTDQTAQNGPVTLRTYTESNGWLGDTSTISSSWATISAYQSYSGNKQQASWLPNEYLAWVWRAFNTLNPPLNLDQPPSLAIIPQGQPVAFQASNNGFTNLSTIRVSDGNQVIATAQAAPLAGNWSQAVAGVHTLIATASNTKNAQTTSLPVTIVVTPPSAETMSKLGLRQRQ